MILWLLLLCKELRDNWINQQQGLHIYSCTNNKHHQSVHSLGQRCNEHHQANTAQNSLSQQPPQKSRGLWDKHHPVSQKHAGNPLPTPSVAQALLMNLNQPQHINLPEWKFFSHSRARNSFWESLCLNLHHRTFFSFLRHSNNHEPKRNQKSKRNLAVCFSFNF